MNLVGAYGPSRICGVRWRGQCGKPGLSSLPEKAMSYGPLCQMRGMKLLHLMLWSITDWVHDMTSEISSRSTGVLDFLLKRLVSENSPFKGQSINSHFVCVNEILQETKTSLNRAGLHIICLSTASVSKLGWNGPNGAHFRSSDPQKFAKQTEYDSKTTVYKQKHLIS